MVAKTAAFRVALTLFAVGALAACGLLKPRPSVPSVQPAWTVTPLSAGVPGGPPPQGWHEAALPQFRNPTRYELVDNGGTTVVRASADKSSSGLIYDLNFDPRARPVLRWRWKVPRLIPGADNTQRELDDAPARIEVVFSGEVAALPFNERVFFAQVKALSGVDVPYATLEYIWGNGAPAGTVIVNTWTSRIRALMVESGPERLGQWVTEERNVYEDFKKAFGEEPDRITHVGIYTDSDATGEKVEAYYGDLEFLAAQADGGHRPQPGPFQPGRR